MSRAATAAQGGRPTKCTRELTEQVCKFIRAGNYMEASAAAAGVNKTSLYEWLKRGAREMELRDAEDAAEEPQRKTKAWKAEQKRMGERREREDVYVQFSNAIEHALAEAEVTLSLRLAKAGANGQWRADAWRLERLFPERWGKRMSVGASGDAGMPGPGADYDLDQLSDDELDELEGILGRAARPGE